MTHGQCHARLTVTLPSFTCGLPECCALDSIICWFWHYICIVCLFTSYVFPLVLFSSLFLAYPLRIDLLHFQAGGHERRPNLSFFSCSSLFCVIIFLCSRLQCFDAVGWAAEGHPACKNWVVRYWHGCLSEARCKWFAYGPADATATSSFLAPVKSRMVYLSGAGLPRLSWKKGC